jgi:manganese/zinc/iron transport system substrate-binding protein
MRTCGFFLVFCLMLLFVGCTAPKKVAKERSWRQDNGKLKVLTTVAMIEDLVAQVGGPYVDTLSLIIGDLDPHSYELVKGDDEKFQYADVIFYNGLGLEHGLSLRQKLEGESKALALGDRVIETVDGASLLVEGEQDPHLWMDISLWSQTVPFIVEALSEALPEQRSYFQEQGSALCLKLNQTDQMLFELVQQIPDQKRFLITSHDAFNYFARRYLNTPGTEDWKERFQAPEGLAPEAQLSVKDLGLIVTYIKNYNVSTLFPESNVSGDSLKKLAFTCAHEGLNIHLCHTPLYGDTMPESGSYVEMMLHNGRVISQELSREESSTRRVERVKLTMQVCHES